MTRADPRRRLTSLGLVALGGAVLAACGGALSDAQVRAANGVSVVRAAATTDPNTGLPAVTDQSTAAGPTAATSVARGGTPTTQPALPGQPIPVTGPAAALSSAAKGKAPTAGKSAAVKTSAAPAGAGTPGQTGPIIVGSVGNYSGAAGAALAGLPRGVQVWAAAINNSGGLFGRQVQVIVEDDGGDPSTYGSDVQDLVENKHVVAFVAQGALLTYQGGADYLQSHGIPVIGSDCSRTDSFQYQNEFQQCPTAAPYINDMFKVVKRIANGTKVGYVYCVESPTCTEETKLYDADAQANGMQVVYKASVSITTIDFTSNCQAAQQAGADVFIVAADPNTLERFAGSCNRQNYHPQYFVAAIGAEASSNQTDGLQGLLLPSYVFPFAGVSGNPAIDEYTAAMAKYDKNEALGPANSQGWAAAKLFQLAATKAAAAEHTITSKSLIDALKTVKNETLGGLTVALNFTTFPATPAGCAFTIKSDPKTKQWGAPDGDTLTC